MGHCLTVVCLCRDKKKAKAAYYASWLDSRQIIFDHAASRPDLFDCMFMSFAPVEGWHPEATDPLRYSNEMKAHAANMKQNFSDQIKNAPPGHVDHILNLYTPTKLSYNPSAYKYLVVMEGGFGRKKHYSLSGRLASFLSTSGAVVLLQESEFRFSLFLQ